MLFCIGYIWNISIWYSNFYLIYILSQNVNHKINIICNSGKKTNFISNPVIKNPKQSFCCKNVIMLQSFYIYPFNTFSDLILLQKIFNILISLMGYDQIWKSQY